jgi:hypothetical protein
MFMGPGPKFNSSMNSLVVLQPDHGMNSLITTRPCPKHALEKRRQLKKKIRMAVRLVFIMTGLRWQNKARSLLRKNSTKNVKELSNIPNIHQQKNRYQRKRISPRLLYVFE